MKDIKIGIDYRPCFIDGKKALFHKWIDKEIPIIKFKGVCKEKELKKALADPEAYRIDDSVEVEIHKATLAIVEYESGKVEEVEPQKITFADNEILKYAFRGIQIMSNLTDNDSIKALAQEEIIKEFAERLKAKAENLDMADGAIETLIYIDDVDNLVKELTEGNI